MFSMNFNSLIEKDSGRNIKILHTDNGVEFCSDEFTIFGKKEGIQKQYTTIYPSME